jgi:subtilisin family serine protease
MKNSLKLPSVILISSFLLFLTVTESGTSLRSSVSASAPLPGNQHNRKISRDLPDQAGPNDNSKVSVVLQTNGTQSQGLSNFLRRSGVRQKEIFENIDAQTIEVPANMLNELAGFNEVKFVSRDRELHGLGHLETTTGAAVMRMQTGNSNLRGRDFNIAVVDSGIYVEHKSVEDSPAQIDFTGENNTADVFGHGTHVASMAAGNSTVLNGSFTGIAPDSQIINLSLCRHLENLRRASLLSANRVQCR